MFDTLEQGGGQPGIYRGLTYAQYESLPGINWSTLRKYKRSPAHARSAQIEPPEPSDAMNFGNAFHRYVLEPVSFQTEYAIVPGDAPTRRSQAGKDWWERFDEETKGKGRITLDELAQMKRMADGLLANKRIADVLEDALREVSIVWVDPEYKAVCKGRIDIVGRLQGVTIVADVKTVEDASDWKMGTALDTFDWAGQIMYYLDGLQVLRPMPNNFARIPFFFAVEKEPPYCARALELGQASRELARTQARAWLKAHVEATRNGSWPGYPDGVIELPKYAFNRVF